METQYRGYQILGFRDPKRRVHIVQKGVVICPADDVADAKRTIDDWMNAP